MKGHNNMAKEKTVLVDVDGVLVSWMPVFKRYAEKMSYKHLVKDRGDFLDVPTYIIEEFNESGELKNLPVYQKADVHVRKLKNDGFNFVAITSVGKSPSVKDHRIDNLQRIYGDDIFNKDNVICLGVHEKKGEVLRDWKNTGLFWIEDSYNNAVDGMSLGLQPVLIPYDYNINQQRLPGLRWACEKDSWKDIHDKIKKDYE